MFCIESITEKNQDLSVKYVERISLAFRHVANSFIVYFLWDLQEVDRYRTAMRKMAADLPHVRENCKRLEVIRFWVLGMVLFSSKMSW